MGRGCAVVDCSKEKNDGVSLFSMPEAAGRDKWLQFLSIVNENYRWKETKCMFLCSDHFDSKSIRIGYQGGSRLNQGGYPTMLNGQIVVHFNDVPLSITAGWSEKSKENSVNTSENELLLSSSEGDCSVLPHMQTETYLEMAARKENEIKMLTAQLAEKDRTITKIKQTLGKCRRSLKSTTTACKRLTERKRKLQMENYSYSKRLKKIQLTRSENSCNIITELQQRQTKRRNAPYSDVLRNFSYTLHYYSARAYDFVRKAVPLLPAARSLFSWTTHIQVSPGVLGASISFLKSQNESSDGTNYYALTLDEMHIRKQIIHRGNQFVGYVNYGDLAEMTNEGNVANAALFIVATQINGFQKIPIAYALTCGLKGDVLAVIITKVLMVMDSIRARVLSITFDGMPSNLKAVELLGANLNPTEENFRPYILHPVTKQKVFIILDPSHMMKLIRNTFKDYEVLLNENDEEIRWSHIQSLQKLQEESGLKAANKLSSRHVYFQNQKMKSKLCLQVLSNSVSVALGVCRELEVEGFESTRGTEEFLSYMDKLFDLLNSRTQGKYFKGAFRKCNIPERMQFFDSCKTYLLKIKRMDGVPLINTARGTAIRGLLICIRSVETICEGFIMADSEILRYLPMYKMSQDMVESLFGVFRARNGFNNNPNVVQLESAVKSTLCMRTQAITNGNCEEQEKMNSAVSFLTSLGTITDDSKECRYEEAPDQSCSIPLEELSPFVSNIVVYIAGWAASRLCAKLSCFKCVTLLHLKQEDIPTVADDCVLVMNRDLGGLFLPSYPTIAVCKLAEQKIRHHRKSGLHKLNKKEIIDEVLHECIMECIPMKCDDSIGKVDHSAALVKNIVLDYTKARFHHMAKQATLELNPTTNRSSCNRNVIFRGN